MKQGIRARATISTIVVVELNLSHRGPWLADCLTGQCLGDVGVEMVAMVVILPVHAGVGADDRRAIVQLHPCSALVRLLDLLSVVYISVENPISASPPTLRPASRDILGLKGLGVIEGGKAATLLRGRPSVISTAPS